jgi:DHA2 family multidrug resistance protein
MAEESMIFQSPERLQGWRFVIFNLMLGVGHMVVLFNAGAYTALSPHTAGDLEGVSPSFACWATTDFMIALALGFPAARWLAQRYGEPRAYVGAFIAFAAASLACAQSESLWLFLPGRMLLGFAGGLTLLLGQSLFLDEYPDRLKSVGLAVWGFFALLPFTIGLALGGWIADELGWRSLFQFNAVAGLDVAAMVGALLYGRLYECRATPFDVVGFMLLGVVLVGIQTILNQGNDFDWFDSPFLTAVLTIEFVAIPAFIIWELGTPFPAVNLHLFQRRNFAIGTLILCADNIRLTLKHRAWYLAQSSDEWVGSGLQDSTGQSGNNLGQDIELRAQWHVNHNVAFDAAYDHFFKGSYITQLSKIPGNPTAEDTDYFYLMTRVRC